MLQQLPFLPRLIRMKDAPAYLGMNRNYFNQVVRPFITEIKIGRQGIAFDRLDLDAWVEDHNNCSGRPEVTNLRRMEQWDKSPHQDYLKEVDSGTLINASADCAFEKALELVRSTKRNVTSRRNVKK